MAPYGYGVIGCGWASVGHAVGAVSLRDKDVDLVAVADADADRLASVADRFDVSHRYTDFNELLERDDIDAVSICVPDYLHHDVAIAAMRAGKHVLCEKPLAMNTAQVHSMIRTAEETGAALSVVFNHRYRPAHRRLYLAARAGGFGRLLIGYVFHSSEVRANPGIPSTWRKRADRVGGGVLTMQTVHFLDILMWALGEPVQRVRCATANRNHPDEQVEDVGAVIVEFESGALVTVAATNASPMDDLTRLELHGTDGYAVLEGYEIQQWKAAAAYQEPPLGLPEIELDPALAAQLFFGPGHVLQVTEFIQDMRNGKPPAVPAQVGLDTVAVLEAAYESSRTGATVVIDSARG